MHRRMQDLGRWARNFYYAVSGESRDLFRGVGGHAPLENFEKNMQFSAF